MPASATKRPQALLRQPSLSSLDTDVQAAPSVKSPFKNPGAPAGYRRGPRMGSWIVDSTKPFAVIDSTGENMVICPARRPAKVAMICASPTNSSTSNPNITSAALQPMLATAPYDNEIDPSGFSRQVSTDAILGSETGMKAPIPTYSESQHLNDQTFAYSSVFFPIEDLPDISTFFDADDRDEDGDDDEELLNVEDFIDFGEDSSEDGEQDESEEMKHFDEGVISAFRRGQKRKLSDSFGRRPSFGVAARRRLIHQH